MNYDNWKLATPPEYEDDSTCYTCSRRPCICGEIALKLKQAKDAAAAERCNACGELACVVCDGCTQPDCEGKLCPCPGVPDDRWAEALDGAIDDAKIRERS